MNKLVTGSLILALAVFQYQIWFGKSSLRALNALEARLESQQASNLEMRERNRYLAVEVKDLQGGLEAVEERARSELGMIGKDETFYLIVE
ncbi:MAG: septum formation initiator family protein [Gammaproteobacteria bacterium]|jgi:cell division protein FtsB